MIVRAEKKHKSCCLSLICSWATTTVCGPIDLWLIVTMRPDILTLTQSYFKGLFKNCIHCCTQKNALVLTLENLTFMQNFQSLRTQINNIKSIKEVCFGFFFLWTWMMKAADYKKKSTFVVLVVVVKLLWFKLTKLNKDQIKRKKYYSQNNKNKTIKNSLF